MTQLDWKRRSASRPRMAGPRPVVSREGWITGRRKAWRMLVELALEFAADPKGDPLHLVHQAIVVRSGRPSGPDPVFAGLGNAGEACGLALAEVAASVKGASAEIRELLAPSLRALGEAVEAFLVEGQTRAAAGWKSQMGDD